MSKKLLVVLAAMVIGLFMTTSAMADTPDEARTILHHFAPILSNNTAATILNPEGKGDVLIFPYYDVRDINGKTQDFLFSIVNHEWTLCEDLATTSQCWDGVAAKLRFREWDKSEEVFDVDIWLSRGDVWVGQLTHNAALARPYGARITSPDYVIIDSNANTLTLGTPLSTGFDFPITAYIPGPTTPPYPAPLAPASPGSDNMLGYIEVIGEERTFDHLFTTSPTPKVSRLTAANGVANCVVNDMGPLPATTCGLWNGKADVPDTLAGTAYVVRVADGQSFAYNAKAIANFNGFDAFAAATLFVGPGNASPQLTNAQDFLESVEFPISKEEVSAAYDIEAVIGGKFSLIYTFPTKHYHFCVKPNYTAIGVPSAPGPAVCANVWPVTAPWTAIDGTVGDHHANTPETFSILIWDRNENRLSPPPCFVSPCPPGTVQGLPYEVNVIGFYQNQVPQLYPTDLTNRNNVGISTGSFDSGWFEMEWGTQSAVHVTVGKFFNFGSFYAGYDGLPGFAMTLQEFQNGAVGGWYGDIRDAWYAWSPFNRTIPINAASPVENALEYP